MHGGAPSGVSPVRLMMAPSVGQCRAGSSVMVESEHGRGRGEAEEHRGHALPRQAPRHRLLQPGTSTEPAGKHQLCLRPINRVSYGLLQPGPSTSTA